MSGAIGYMRTSTRKQRFAQQEVHFARHGFGSIEVLRDHGWSGFEPLRPALLAACARLDEDPHLVLVVSSWCRLSRLPSHAALLAAALGPRLIVLDALDRRAAA